MPATTAPPTPKSATLKPAAAPAAAAAAAGDSAGARPTKRPPPSSALTSFSGLVTRARSRSRSKFHSAGACDKVQSRPPASPSTNSNHKPPPPSLSASKQFNPFSKRSSSTTDLKVSIPWPTTPTVPQSGEAAPATSATPGRRRWRDTRDLSLIRAEMSASEPSTPAVHMAASSTPSQTGREMGRLHDAVDLRSHTDMSRGWGQRMNSANISAGNLSEMRGPYRNPPGMLSTPSLTRANRSYSGHQVRELVSVPFEVMLGLEDTPYSILPLPGSPYASQPSTPLGEFPSGFPSFPWLNLPPSPSTAASKGPSLGTSPLANANVPAVLSVGKDEQADKEAEGVKDVKEQTSTQRTSATSVPSIAVDVAGPAVIHFPAASLSDSVPDALAAPVAADVETKAVAATANIAEPIASRPLPNPVAPRAQAVDDDWIASLGDMSQFAPVTTTVPTEVSSVQLTPATPRASVVAAVPRALPTPPTLAARTSTVRALPTPLVAMAAPHPLPTPPTSVAQDALPASKPLAELFAAEADGPVKSVAAPVAAGAALAAASADETVPKSFEQRADNVDAPSSALFASDSPATDDSSKVTSDPWATVSVEPLAAVQNEPYTHSRQSSLSQVSMYSSSPLDDVLDSMDNELSDEQDDYEEVPTSDSVAAELHFDGRTGSMPGAFEVDASEDVTAPDPTTGAIEPTQTTEPTQVAETAQESTASEDNVAHGMMPKAAEAAESDHSQEVEGEAPTADGLNSIVPAPESIEGVAPTTEFPEPVVIKESDAPAKEVVEPKVDTADATVFEGLNSSMFTTDATEAPVADEALVFTEAPVATKVPVTTEAPVTSEAPVTIDDYEAAVAAEAPAATVNGIDEPTTETSNKVAETTAPAQDVPAAEAAFESKEADDASEVPAMSRGFTSSGPPTTESTHPPLTAPGSEDKWEARSYTPSSEYSAEPWMSSSPFAATPGLQSPRSPQSPDCILTAEPIPVWRNSDHPLPRAAQPSPEPQRTGVLSKLRARAMSWSKIRRPSFMSECKGAVLASVQLQAPVQPQSKVVPTTQSASSPAQTPKKPSSAAMGKSPSAWKWNNKASKAPPVPSPTFTTPRKPTPTGAPAHKAAAAAKLPTLPLDQKPFPTKSFSLPTATTPISSSVPGLSKLAPEKSSSLPPASASTGEAKASASTVTKVAVPQTPKTPLSPALSTGPSASVKSPASSYASFVTAQNRSTPHLASPTTSAVAAPSTPTSPTTGSPRPRVRASSFSSSAWKAFQRLGKENKVPVPTVPSTPKLHMDTATTGLGFQGVALPKELSSVPTTDN